MKSRLATALQKAWWQLPPNALARALRPASALYAALAYLDKALTRPRSLDVPVLVVGNLVVGGAGKTPTVIALVRLLRAYGWAPGVISRGYGRRSRGVVSVTSDSSATECGDEPLLIRLRTGAPVMVGRDRVAAGRALRIRHPTVDIVISDDGLQHHRLARDAQVVVFDERSTLGLVKIRAKKASYEVAAILDDAAKDSKAFSIAQDSVFADISDDDIDSHFA